MFFDFNVPYSKDVNDPYATKAVSFSQRAETAVHNLVSIPGSILRTIVEIANLIFFALGVALTFGKSKDIRDSLFRAFKNVIFLPAFTALEFIGFFAPVNAGKWNNEVTRIYFGI